jgi:hypothetical protein
MQGLRRTPPSGLGGRRRVWPAPVHREYGSSLRAARVQSSVRSKAAAIATLAALLVAGAGVVPASAEALTPTNLRISPGLGSLALRWGVTSTQELSGFRVRWRPVSPIGATWGPAVERPPGARGYTINGLSIQPYEVMVRAIMTGGKLGGRIRGRGTPLLQEVIQEETKEEEEAPAQEPPPEEEAPEEEAPEEGPVEGRVLWKGDASEPLYQQWPEVSDQEHCAEVSSGANLPDSRIKVEDTGLAGESSKGKAIKLTLRATDTGCYLGRTELGTGNPTKQGKQGFPWTFNVGDEVWIAMEAAWPQGAPGGLFQLHEYGGPGSPPFGGGPGGNLHLPLLPAPWEFHLQNNSEPGGLVTPFIAGSELVQPNTWYRVVFHAVFQLSNTGLLEIYSGPKSAGTPRLQYANHAASLLKSGYTPTHIRVGNYLGVTPTAESVLYLAGFTVATTREAAEANAFN